MIFSLAIICFKQFFVFFYHLIYFNKFVQLENIFESPICLCKIPLSLKQLKYFNHINRHVKKKKKKKNQMSHVNLLHNSHCLIFLYNLSWVQDTRWLLWYLGIGPLNPTNLPPLFVL